MAITPDGAHAYVPNGTPVAAGSTPAAITLAPDGKHFYLSNGQSGTVSVITTATGEVSATIPVGNIPGSVAIAPDGKHALRTPTAATERCR